MTEDRRTKAQLVAELERLEVRVSDLSKLIPANPPRVPEAEALAACIRALDTLKDTTRGRNNYGLNSDHNPEVARTLLALSEKYGIKRVEKITEPCTRRHVEDVNAMDVIDAFRRDLGGINL